MKLDQVTPSGEVEDRRDTIEVGGGFIDCIRNRNFPGDRVCVPGTGVYKPGKVVPNPNKVKPSFLDVIGGLFGN